MSAKSTAALIASLFDNDGTRCLTMLGDHIDDICVKQNGTLDINGEQWRYAFPDGSAITGTSNGWDIEGDKPFVMAGA